MPGSEMTPLLVGGRTAVYLMLANPIAQTKSPSMFNAHFRANSIDACVMPLAIPVDRFGDVWLALKTIENVRGALISVPFKAAAFDGADRATPRAARVRTANVLRREADGSFTADNFDGAGFSSGLQAGGINVAGKTALLVGAGGAGASIAFSLMDDGVDRLQICDADGARAVDLAERVARTFPHIRVTAGPSDAAGFDVVVNATPLGLQNVDPLPFDVARLEGHATVVDIIMEPKETRLLRLARDKGCTVQNGQVMMTCQFKLLLEFLQAD